MAEFELLEGDYLIKIKVLHLLHYFINLIILLPLLMNQNCCQKTKTLFFLAYVKYFTSASVHYLFSSNLINETINLRITCINRFNMFIHIFDFLRDLFIYWILWIYEW